MLRQSGMLVQKSRWLRQGFIIWSHSKVNMIYPIYISWCTDTRPFYLLRSTTSIILGLPLRDPTTPAMPSSAFSYQEVEPENGLARPKHSGVELSHTTQKLTTVGSSARCITWKSPKLQVPGTRESRNPTVRGRPGSNIHKHSQRSLGWMPRPRAGIRWNAQQDLTSAYLFNQRKNLLLAENAYLIFPTSSTHPLEDERQLPMARLAALSTVDSILLTPC